MRPYLDIASISVDSVAIAYLLILCPLLAAKIYHYRQTKKLRDIEKNLDFISRFAEKVAEMRGESSRN